MRSEGLHHVPRAPIGDDSVFADFEAFFARVEQSIWLSDKVKRLNEFFAGLNASGKGLFSADMDDFDSMITEALESDVEVLQEMPEGIGRMHEDNGLLILVASVQSAFRNKAGILHMGTVTHPDGLSKVVIAEPSQKTPGIFTADFYAIESDNWRFLSSGEKPLHEIGIELINPLEH